MIRQHTIRVAALATSTLCLGLLGFGSQACSSQGVADDNSAEGAAAQVAATGASTTDIDAAYAKVKDDVGYVCKGGTPTAYKIQDAARITVDPDRDFTKSSGPEKKFAAATVLAAMRRLRRYYNAAPYAANSTTNPVRITAEGSHASTAPLDSCNPTFNGPFDRCTGAYPFNQSDDGSTGNNMRVMPAKWSDLQITIYILAPHARHGCWTNALLRGGLKGGGCTTPVDGKTPAADIREAVRDFCTGQVTFSGGCGDFRAALEGVPAQFSSYNLLWVDPKTSTFVSLPEDIRTDYPDATVGTTVADVPKTKGAILAKKQRDAGMVNVWDYIMLGQYYAFDFEQQQAVLNAYYADNKKWAGDTTPFNPCDKTECSKWRATRPTDPQDGTHCSTDKPNTGGVGQGPWN